MCVIYYIQFPINESPSSRALCINQSRVNNSFIIRTRTFSTPASALPLYGSYGRDLFNYATVALRVNLGNSLIRRVCKCAPVVVRISRQVNYEFDVSGFASFPVRYYFVTETLYGENEGFPCSVGKKQWLVFSGFAMSSLLCGFCFFRVESVWCCLKNSTVSSWCILLWKKSYLNV